MKEMKEYVRETIKTLILEHPGGYETEVVIKGIDKEIELSSKTPEGERLDFVILTMNELAKITKIANEWIGDAE